MEKQVVTPFLLGVLIGGGLVFGYQAVTSESAVSESVDQAREASLMPHNQGGQMGMMQQMAVTSERAFIEQMIPHHQEAIDTAGEVLARGGTTKEVRDLMNTIIAAQTAEVEAMQRWYETWFSEPYKNNGTYEPMMRELAGLRGETLDRVFLEDMIMHHMGAIMMARSVQPYLEHEEMTKLTQNIVTTQSAEISQMREMLQNF